MIEVDNAVVGFSTGYEKVGNTLTVYLNTNSHTRDPKLKDLQRDLIMLDLLTPKVIFKKGFAESQMINLKLISLNLDDNTRSVSQNLEIEVETKRISEIAPEGKIKK